MTKTAAVLLAAGLSRRMGQMKALLPWYGRPLIQYQIEQMKQANMDEIIVVLGYQAERLRNIISPLNVRTVINETYEGGKSSSIQKGVSSIQGEPKGILIAAIDQPVPSTVLRKMAKRLIETKTVAVIPTYGQKKGHPILFHGSLKAELISVQEETMGLRSVIHKFHDQITYLEVDDSSVLYNFNQPEDYVRNRQEVSNESVRD